MASITAPTAILGAGALGVGGSLISAGASKNAADAQQQAALSQQNTTLAMFDQIQQNLQPYMQAGQSGLTALAQGLGLAPGDGPAGANGSLTAKFQPTMAQLQQTPGYEFTLGQGQESTQNSYAAQGLGTSGAAMKGATQYAEGLASTTYQQQFQNYLTQNQQIYNMLGGISGNGQNAASGLGSLGLNATGQINQAIMSGGNANAAGIVGSANALSGGLNSIGSSGLLYGLNAAGMFGNQNSSPFSAITGGTYPSFAG